MNNQQQFQPQPIQQNVHNNPTSPIQQQPNMISPRNINIVNQQQPPPNLTSPIQQPLNITSPLPTSSLLSQQLLTIESKASQLQQLNKDIYQLLKITTPTTQNDVDDNIENETNNENNINSLEYHKNVQLLNQYKIKVQELIKELQLDLFNQNISLHFLTPILNDQQDTLFYEPILPPSATAEGEGSTTDEKMDTTTTTPTFTIETPEQHNIKLFNEKFQQQLTVETVQKQLQDWDTLCKDREKLNKNADRVKFTLFNDKNR